MAPHRYPTWLLTSATVVPIAAIYSLVLVPDYFRAGSLLQDARKAVSRNQPDAAKENLLQALQLIPTSKAVRIEIAILYFRNSSRADHAKALQYLAGINLSKSDMRRLREAMPAE